MNLISMLQVAISKRNDETPRRRRIQDTLVYNNTVHMNEYIAISVDPPLK